MHCTAQSNTDIANSHDNIFGGVPHFWWSCRGSLATLGFYDSVWFPVGSDLAVPFPLPKIFTWICQTTEPRIFCLHSTMALLISSRFQITTLPSFQIQTAWFKFSYFCKHGSFHSTFCTRNQETWVKGGRENSKNGRPLWKWPPAVCKYKVCRFAVSYFTAVQECNFWEMSTYWLGYQK